MTDRLVAALGEENVVRDVDSFPAGEDFRRITEERVRTVDVVLAVIGEGWSLDEVHPDYVATELRVALKAGVRVVPVLVQGAAMPHPLSLPGDLESLAFRNAMPVRRDPDFHKDMDRLLKDLHVFGGAASRELTAIRRRLLEAPSEAELRRLSYEVDRILEREADLTSHFMPGEWNHEDVGH